LISSAFEKAQQNLFPFSIFFHIGLITKSPCERDKNAKMDEIHTILIQAFVLMVAPLRAAPKTISASSYSPF